MLLPRFPPLSLSRTFFMVWQSQILIAGLKTRTRPAHVNGSKARIITLVHTLTAFRVESVSGRAFVNSLLWRPTIHCKKPVTAISSESASPIMSSHAFTCARALKERISFFLIRPREGLALTPR
jgi:hypothetical protein